MSQEEAAERAGYSHEFVRQIERGEKQPSFNCIIVLAKALDVSPGAFFRFDREETSAKSLRRRIKVLLAKCSAQQLLQTYQVLASIIDP